MRTSAVPPASDSLLARARAVEAAVQRGRGTASEWLSGRSAALLTSATGLLLLMLFYRQLFRGGPVIAAASMLVVALFIGTLYYIEIGMASIILAMLLSPEISIGSLGNRDLTLRLEDILIPLVVVAWLGRKALGLERREIRFEPVFVPMLAFLSLQTITTFAGWGYYRLDIGTAFFYVLKQAEYYAIFFFTFQYLDSEKKTRAVLVLAVATAILLALYNIVLIPSAEIWTRNRLTAPFEGENPEPSSIGGYFVLALAVILALVIEAPNRRVRIYLAALFGVVFVPLLYTLSRTSYVSFLAMLLIFAWMKRSLKLLGVIVAGLAAAPFVLPRAVIDRVMYTFNDVIKEPVFGLFDRSFGERLAIWYKVAFRVKKNPMFGRGVTYDSVIDSYYARLLIENGVVGLVLFGIICYFLYRLAARVRQHPVWWARALGLGYSAGLTALLVHNFSAITFVIVRIMEPFWLFTGILAAIAHPMREAPAVAVADTTPDPPIRRSSAHG